MGELVFLAIGVVVGATFYGIVRASLRKWSGGYFFAQDGVIKPPKPPQA